MDIAPISTATASAMLSGPFGSFLIVLLIVTLMLKELYVNLETESRIARRVLNVVILLLFAAFLSVIVVRINQIL
jgi:hypothetical protein